MMMDGSINRVIRYLSLALLLLLCACTINRSSPSRFYILSPLSSLGITGQASDGKDKLNIGVELVKLPTYLDRPQIVTRRSANEIELPEFDKWGEPLAEGIFRVVSENLSGLLSSRLVSVSNWEGARSNDYLVMLKVIRFDGDLGGNVTLIANWSILGHKGKEILLAGRSSFTEPTGAPDYEAFVKAQSRAIGSLSQIIAEGINSLSGDRK
ncbi:membrane integrity-associated transporter subunit PqiC [Thermodesulfobacteriota bacterium]